MEQGTLYLSDSDGRMGGGGGLYPMNNTAAGSHSLDTRRQDEDFLGKIISTSVSIIITCLIGKKMCSRQWKQLIINSRAVT